MTTDVGAQLAKWRSWIEKDIRSDVVGMHFKRMIWREVQQMVAANPEVGDVPSAFWDFYGENYAAAQAIAVRRQADRDARTCSLARLIKEIQDDAELLTRDYYVGLLDERTDSDLLVKRANSDFDRLAGSGDHLDPEIAARDFEVLQNNAHRLRIYVNEHVAHDMAEPTVPEMPTYADLHAAIESVGEIFKKYAVTLTGGWWATLEPAIQGDWKAIFRVPWLPS